MLAFGVATRYLSHLDIRPGAQTAARGNDAGFFLLAMLTACADFSDAYFLHLAVAALLWLIGSATWLVFLGPRLLRGASHH
jgi:hypothetical protein